MQENKIDNDLSTQHIAFNEVVRDWYAMADSIPDTSNGIIESKLYQKIGDLENVTQSAVVTFIGPIWHGIDDYIRGAVESIDSDYGKLTFVLETSGGSIEVVQRIVDTLRYHYDHVEFIIPNFAMSAGTVLVMSGDAIYMDYYSVLGPIDPQVEKAGQDYIPALGYLVQFERLIKKSAKGELTTAELAYMIERFDPAELYRYEQARELSTSLLREWLAKYKFKDWTETETQRQPVTQAKREERATEIAMGLSDTERWHSHGRGISMDVLRNDLNLKIEDFGDIPQLNTAVRSYYDLMRDYMMRRSHSIVTHSKGRYVGM